jgi:hypothetical protein
MKEAEVSTTIVPKEDNTDGISIENIETIVAKESITEEVPIQKTETDQDRNDVEKKEDMILENKVFDFIKGSKEGAKIGELTELVKSVDESVDTQELLLSMIGQHRIRKYQFKYFAVGDK